MDALLFVARCPVALLQDRVCNVQAAEGTYRHRTPCVSSRHVRHRGHRGCFRVGQGAAGRNSANRPFSFQRPYQWTIGHREGASRPSRPFAQPGESQPYIVIDCAAINGTLFASQVFGHVKGAFTGAFHDSIGSFRAADGGTILFDEIGELELEFQVKLLRVLQHRTVTPIGGHTAIPVDVRIIAATNRDLKALVHAGRFREDLFYRLNVISLKTIPLKDRPEDIDVLADHILAKIALRSGLPPKRLPPEWLDCMRRHNWPGNVRELENFLERIAIVPDEEIQPGIVQCLCPGKAIASGGHLEKCSQTDDLFDCSSKRDGTCPWRYGMPSDELGDGRAWQTLAEAERQHIVPHA